jgi:hypothetical protein
MIPIEKSNLLKEDEIKTIFSNIRVIYQCNYILLRELEGRVYQGNLDATVVAKIFNHLVDSLF